MSVHKNQIHDTLLFKRFEGLPNCMDEITRAEAKQLETIVLDIADLVGPMMEKVGETFSQYTDHSLTHLCNIADIINRFLPKSKIKKNGKVGLNALELTLLWAGILLHDVGMFVTEDEKEADLKSEAFRRFRLRSKARVEAADRARKAGQPRRAQVIEEALIAEFYRRGHARRSNDFVTKHLSQKFFFRKVDLSEMMGQIAESHNWRVFQRDGGLSNDPYVAQLEAEELFGSVPVNMRYIACCLRMGDIMDFDRSRAPLVIFENLDFAEDISRVEWNKHLSIIGWKVTKAELFYKAQCDHPEYYVAVQEFLGWIDDELESFSLIVDGFRKKVAKRYPLPLPHRVKRDKLRMKNPNHITGAFKYQLEFEEIMQLLMDKSLYPDPALFLRELLQNSLDACRYQKALAIQEGMADKYEPRIDVWDYSNDLEDPRIIFRDNGYGMDMRTVEQYFLRVGKSYYRSPDFTMERDSLAEKGIFLDSCSRFGIGFLSCFLAGDYIEVETFRLGAPNPLKINITGPSRYFLLEKVESKQRSTSFLSPKDRHEDGPPGYPGTKVTVHLKQGWRDGFKATKLGVVYDTIHTYAVATEFPIMVHLDSRPVPLEITGDEFSRKSYPKVYRSEGFDKEPNLWEDPLALVEIPLPEGDETVKFSGRIWALMLKDGTKYGGRNHKGLSLSLPPDVDFDPSGKMAVRFQSPYHDVIGWFIELRKQIKKASGRNFERTGFNDYMYANRNFISAWKALDQDEKSKIESDLLRFTFDIDEWEFKAPAFLKSVSDSDHVTITRQLLGKKPWDNRIVEFDQGELSIALHGILTPGGILNWSPDKGDVEKALVLPGGIYAALNIFGDGAPNPSANRLYIPPDNFKGITPLVNERVLLWASEGLDAHPGDKGWELYFDYIYRFCLLQVPAVILENLPKLVDKLKIIYVSKEIEKPNENSPQTEEQPGDELEELVALLEDPEQYNDLKPLIESYSGKLIQHLLELAKKDQSSISEVVRNLESSLVDLDAPQENRIEFEKFLIKFLIEVAETAPTDSTQKTPDEQDRYTTLAEALSVNHGRLPVLNWDSLGDLESYIFPLYEDLEIFQEAPLIKGENGQCYRDLREWVKKYLPGMRIEELD